MKGPQQPKKVVDPGPDSGEADGVGGGKRLHSMATTVTRMIGRGMIDTRRVNEYLLRSSSIRRDIAKRKRSLRNRMRELRTPGSVGALGGQLPRATRPDKEMVKRAFHLHAGHWFATQGDVLARRGRKGVHNGCQDIS